MLVQRIIAALATAAFDSDAEEAVPQTKQKDAMAKAMFKNHFVSRCLRSGWRD